MGTAKEKIIFSLLLLAMGISYRFIPHPPNFSPVAAIALFGGFYYRKAWSVFLPLVILFISDIFIGFYQIEIMFSVYFSFVLVALLGILIKRKKSLISIISCSLAGSVFFFLITNFSVWLFSGWYPHNLFGLSDCFLLAIPFFRNTLLGDLFFVSILFGAYEFSRAYIYRRSLMTSTLKKI